jgi:hypothetical protein
VIGEFRHHRAEGDFPGVLALSHHVVFGYTRFRTEEVREVAGDEDDATAALQHWQRLLRRTNLAIPVQYHSVIDRDILLEATARVQHQKIELPERCLDAGEHRIDSARVGHIGFNKQCFATRGPNCFRDLPGAPHLAAVVDRDVEAAPGE